MTKTLGEEIAAIESLSPDDLHELTWWLYSYEGSSAVESLAARVRDFVVEHGTRPMLYVGRDVYSELRREIGTDADLYQTTVDDRFPAIALQTPSGTVPVKRDAHLPDIQVNAVGRARRANPEPVQLLPDAPDPVTEPTMAALVAGVEEFVRTVGQLPHVYVGDGVYQALRDERPDGATITVMTPLGGVVVCTSPECERDEVLLRYTRKVSLLRLQYTRRASLTTTDVTSGSIVERIQRATISLVEVGAKPPFVAHAAAQAMVLLHRELGVSDPSHPTGFQRVQISTPAGMVSVIPMGDADGHQVAVVSADGRSEQPDTWTLPDDAPAPEIVPHGRVPVTCQHPGHNGIAYLDGKPESDGTEIADVPEHRPRAQVICQGDYLDDWE